MKKALIFDCYDDYNIRIQYIQRALEKKGYTVSIFFSDFNHYQKKKYDQKREGVTYIPTRSYRKNLSLQRLYSHYEFAKKCCQIAELEADVDLIYVMVPPNSMVKQFAAYKKKHPDVLIWFDVLDMWPESLPISNRLKTLILWPLKVWGNMRNRWIHMGDLITVECHKFYEVIKKSVDEAKMQTVYLCQPDHQLYDAKSYGDEIHFLYCGSMNHLMDVDLMIAFLTQMSQKKKVVLELIGDGENRKSLIDCLINHQISYLYHGFVYDEEKKKEIYQRCHFGLNLMKETVFVGLTMKSLDYLSHALPIINNIPDDTYEIVEKERIGYNITQMNLERMINQIADLSEKEYQDIQNHTIHTFQRFFSEDVVLQQISECIKDLENRGQEV